MIKKQNQWLKHHPVLTITALVGFPPPPTYLRGLVRAPAVLVTVEASQQNIFVSIHLAKPQCLLCVITDYKMAEDQFFCLRALVLKGKEYESQTSVRLIARCLAAVCPVANVSTPKKKNPSPGASLAYKVFHIINGKEIYGSQTCIFIYGPSTVNHKQPKAKEDNEILTFKDLFEAK